MSSIGILTCNFGRLRILELWCASVHRLRTELGVYVPACVVSGEEDKAVCDKYKITHIRWHNRPVSEKFNQGMQWVKNMGLDYGCISGSDDIFSTETFRKILDATQSDYDLIGIDSIYFYGTEGIHRGTLVKLQGSRMLGVGKCIHKRVLEQVDYRPWNENKNWGLDAIASKCIAPYVKSFKIISDAKVFDCKSSMNINKMNVWANKFDKLDPQEFYSILSDEEKQILQTI